MSKILIGGCAEFSEVVGSAFKSKDIDVALLIVKDKLDGLFQYVKQRPGVKVVVVEREAFPEDLDKRLQALKGMGLSIVLIARPRTDNPQREELDFEKLGASAAVMKASMYLQRTVTAACNLAGIDLPEAAASTAGKAPHIPSFLGGKPGGALPGPNEHKETPVALAVASAVAGNSPDAVGGILSGLVQSISALQGEYARKVEELQAIEQAVIDCQGQLDTIIASMKATRRSLAMSPRQRKEALDPASGQGPASGRHGDERESDSRTPLLVGKKPVNFTHKELLFIQPLLAAQGKAVSREVLMRGNGTHVAFSSTPEFYAVRKSVHNRLLEKYPEAAARLMNERGVGYSLDLTGL